VLLLAIQELFIIAMIDPLGALFKSVGGGV